MDYRMTVILKKLVDDTFDPYSKTDCLGDMSRALGLSEDSNCLWQRIRQSDILFSNALVMFDYLGYNVCVVREETIVLSSLDTAMNLIKSTLSWDKLKKTEFAEMLGVSYQAMMKYFAKPNLKSRTIVKLFNTLGYTVVVKSKKPGGKTYFVGDADHSDQVMGCMYEEALSWADSKNNTHITFFDAFIEGNIVYDHNAQVSVKALYEQYVQFWEYNRELHPRTSDGKKEIGHLSRKVFTEFVMNKFGGDGKKCFGISLKKEA